MTPRHITECIPPALKKKGRVVSLAAPGVPELGACAPFDAREFRAFCESILDSDSRGLSGSALFASIESHLDASAALRVLDIFQKRAGAAHG